MGRESERKKRWGERVRERRDGERESERKKRWRERE